MLLSRIVAAAAALIVLSASSAEGYLPILVVRGVFSTAKKYDGLVAMIQAAHPGTEVIVPTCWPGPLSAVPLWKQLNCYVKAVEELDTPINLISVSQGGILARMLLETTANHQVHNWVAYSSPHQGQFGITSYLEPIIPKKYQNTSKDDIWKFFYGKFAQSAISIAEYWKDPSEMPAYLGQQPPLVGSTVLAVINNETANPYASEWRDNFLKINSLTLIGGPDDGVITPWWSALFDWQDSNGTRISMNDTAVYQSDSFGLRTLNEAGKVSTHTYSGIKHTAWKDNQQVFNEAAEPMLT